jgi:hypothetical protein
MEHPFPAVHQAPTARSISAWGTAPGNPGGYKLHRPSLVPILGSGLRGASPVAITILGAMPQAGMGRAVGAGCAAHGPTLCVYMKSHHGTPFPGGPPSANGALDISLGHRPRKSGRIQTSLAKPCSHPWIGIAWGIACCDYDPWGDAPGWYGPRRWRWLRGTWAHALCVHEIPSRNTRSRRSTKRQRRARYQPGAPPQEIRADTNFAGLALFPSMDRDCHGQHDDPWGGAPGWYGPRRWRWLRGTWANSLVCT